ncbi:hypothetical protein GE061_015980 [Apolygus lucorum]|uniref:Major facilitator superfamily (MFS) profile domain-containing protein n=1 Tax=Apolygus lucorum TaxID=248454 RepID=A0A8S9XG44_APOLU|nr:hypothetical protein GE061_015980 [Apolygus lucorum]
MGQKLMNLMKKEKPEPEPEIDPLTEQELEALARRTRRLGAYRQLFSSIVISFTFLVMGSSVGWTSPVLYNMRETGQPMNLSTSDATVMVSVYYLGNAVMPIPSGILSDVKGRKSSLSCLLIFPFVSWVLIYFAKRPVVLHVARLLAGMWTGIVITVGPMYLAELAQPQYRGALSTLLMILANLGALLAMVIGMRVSYWTMAVVFGLTPSSTDDVLSGKDDTPDNGLEKTKNRRCRLGLFRQWIASIFMSTSYLIIGTSIGWPSPVLYAMRKTGEPFNMTTADVSIMEPIKEQHGHSRG